jgi:hypothetical protein
MPTCSTSHNAAPVAAPTFSDHFHPELLTRPPDCHRSNLHRLKSSFFECAHFIRLLEAPDQEMIVGRLTFLNLADEEVVSQTIQNQRSASGGEDNYSFLGLFENKWNERRVNFHTSHHRGFEQFAAFEIGFTRCECELHPGYRPKIGATLLDCGRCRIDIHVQRPNIAATRD